MGARKPKCTHLETTEILTPEGPHYGKLVCSVCGAYKKFLPRPPRSKKTRMTAAEMFPPSTPREPAEWDTVCPF